MRRVMMIFGVVAVAAVIGTAGYLGYRNAQPPQPVVQTAPPTMKVGRGDVEKSVTAPGQLVNDRQTVLGMEEGGRLTSVNVSAGDYVERPARCWRPSTLPPCAQPPIRPMPITLRRKHNIA